MELAKVMTAAFAVGFVGAGMYASWRDKKVTKKAFSPLMNFVNGKLVSVNYAPLVREYKQVDPAFHLNLHLQLQLHWWATTAVAKLSLCAITSARRCILGGTVCSIPLVACF